MCAIIAHLGFCAWALFNSWFYTDDYRLLLEAESTPFSLSALLDPFDSQFMPLGLAVVELVASSGELNWALAATLTLVASATAAGACLVMLCTLFGRGWHIVPLLLVFLTTSITVPALMWWAAALNQLPPQACFFFAVAWWVTYLRTRHTRWAVGASLAVIVALGFYVKAILIIPALAILTLGYFYNGALTLRIKAMIVEHWRVLAPAAFVGIAYAVFYKTQVPQPFSGSEGTKVAEVADSLLGKALPTGLLGGPWQWWNTNPPIVLAQPPTWLVSASWVVLALTVIYALLRRVNTWPAWVLLSLHAVADFVLLATSRGQEYGALAGMDYRYLTDVGCAAVLAFGLAFLRLVGAPHPSRTRSPTILTMKANRFVVGGFTAAVCLGGAASSLGYVHYWHHDNAGKTYVRNLQRSLHEYEALPLVNQTMPAPVMPAYTAPMNQTSEFVRLIDAEATFPVASTELFLLDDFGQPQPATVSPNVSTGQGPRDGCGWLVSSDPVTLELDAPAFDWGWWVRIGTLSSSPTTLEVTTGTEQTTVDVPAGLGNAFLHTTGEFSDVILAAPNGAKICIDRVDVGEVVRAR